MQELEKILKEIKGLHGKVGSECTIEDRHAKRAWEHCLKRVEDIVSNHMNDGWIPVEERLPEEPKENPVFDDKPLELYLVDMGGSYPLRAFWNGKEFTDGWSVLKVTAWMPLPEPYRPERRSDEKE